MGFKTELQAEIAFMAQVANIHKPTQELVPPAEPPYTELDFDLPEFAVQKRLNDGDVEAAFTAAYELDPTYASVNHVLTVLYPHDSTKALEAAHFLAGSIPAPIQIEDPVYQSTVYELIKMAHEAYQIREQNALTIGQIALDQV